MTTGNRPNTAGRRAVLFMGLMWLGAMASVGNAQEADRRREVSIEFDSLAGAVIDGVETFLAVNARLKQGETYLRAASMRDEGPKGYLFEGNVRIIERGDTIYADVVRYDKETKIGRASGNVRLMDGQVQLKSASTLYYTREKRAVFDSGVSMVDSLTVLESDRGVYWSEESRAEFTGNVRLAQADLYVEADSVVYERESERTWAIGNVFVFRLARSSVGAEPFRPDSLQFPELTEGSNPDRTLLFGHRVFHDGQTDSSHVSGGVMLLQIRSDSTATDSLLIEARTMILTRMAESERLIAIDSVSVVEEKFSVTGDSLVFDSVGSDEDERLSTRMFGNAMAWLENTQISSDSLSTAGHGCGLDSLNAVGNVFVASEDSTLNRIQQVRGRSLVAHFSSDSLRTLSVSPNAEALYFMTGDENQLIGAIRASADRIVFTFDNGEVSDIGVFAGVEGTYYPENLVDQAESLTGFVWTPERKPDRKMMLQMLNARLAALNAGRQKRSSSSVEDAK